MRKVGSRRVRAIRQAVLDVSQLGKVNMIQWSVMIDGSLVVILATEDVGSSDLFLYYRIFDYWCVIYFFSGVLCYMSFGIFLHWRFVNSFAV